MGALLNRPGTVLSRSQLEQKVYPWEAQLESNAIERNMCRLLIASALKSAVELFPTRRRTAPRMTRGGTVTT
jgi:DNA-binding response OmpR family regulator